MSENNQEPRHKQRSMNRKQINATRCKHREIKPTGGINDKLRGIPSVDIFFKSKEGKLLAEEFGAGIAKFLYFSANINEGLCFCKRKFCALGLKTSP